MTEEQQEVEEVEDIDELTPDEVAEIADGSDQIVAPEEEGEDNGKEEEVQVSG